MTLMFQWLIARCLHGYKQKLSRHQLEVRWKDVVKTVYVDASATASDVAMTAYTAVVAALEGNVITAPPELPIILKATGWNEYLTSPDTCLWKFNHVYSCLRDGVPVGVTIQEISQADADMLWSTDSPVRYRGGSGLPAVLTPPIRHSRVDMMSQDKMCVPLRVRAIGVENLYGVHPSCKLKLSFIIAAGTFQLDDAVASTVLADMFLESLDADEDWDADNTSTPAAQSSFDGVSGDSITSPASTTTDSPNARATNSSETTSGGKVSGPFYARWNDDMLSTGFDVSTLPTCARMLVVLTSVSPATLEEKRLAVVALPLFDENRVIRGGRWAMRMFHCKSSDSSDGVGIATRGSSVADDDGSGSEHSDDGIRARAGSKAFGTPQTSSGGDSMSSKASLVNSFPLHVVAGPYAENEVDDDSPVVLFQLDRYMLPVQAPQPNYQSILTSADVAHSMSIVKLDPSRPSVVSVMRRSASSGGSSEDNPIAAFAALQKEAQTPAIASPSGTSMLMVSSTMRATRRASIMAATTMFESSVPAMMSPLPPAVKESPLIVPVTDTLDKSEIHLLSDILSRDPLSIRSGFTQPERRLLWKVREDLTGISSALPKLLRCVSWHRVEQRKIVHALLQRWVSVDPEHSLQLLDCYYADELVRAFAVRCLESTSDDELTVFLQPLVQALKYEPFHDSFLARELIRRALWNPNDIGVPLFWLLKGDSHLPGFRQRATLLLHVLVSHLGPFQSVIAEQVKVNNVFAELVRDVGAAAKEKRRSGAENTAYARSQLAEFAAALPAQFTLPLSTRMACRSLKVEKCRVMDSKQAPLWVEFDNADPHGRVHKILFKAGDDLRQDLLTLQLIRIMSELWLSKGLHLPTQVYQCVCTGDEVGMLEIVQNAQTTSNIQSRAGVLMGAWAKRPIVEFLVEHNSGEEAYARATSNFVRSCAAYCVATFVLGIGDRHPSNIMVTHDGNLFHIDFGHFLGNFKTKTVGGITVRRERAPFVFTPQMAQVMKETDSTLYSQFEQACVDAYNVVREHGFLFLTYFVAMLPAGLPELASEADINYLRKKLAVEATDKDAADQFKREIDNSLASVSRQLDNMAHLTKHARG